MTAHRIVQNDDGRIGCADRAVAASPSSPQAVSPVPASIPCAAEIATCLTKEQRRAIAQAMRVAGGWEIRMGEDDCETLEAIGLTGEDGWIDRLTALGVAVKAEVE